MKSVRSAQYLVGDALPSTWQRTKGSSQREDMRRMNEWLAKRGIPSGWRRAKPKGAKKG